MTIQQKQIVQRNAICNTATFGSGRFSQFEIETFGP